MVRNPVCSFILELQLRTHPLRKGLCRLSTTRTVYSTRILIAFSCAIVFTLSSNSALRAAVNNNYGTSGALSGSVWNTNPAGPLYNQAFATDASGGIANFGNAATLTGGANTLIVAGVNATANFTISGSPSGTISNFSNGVVS